MSEIELYGGELDGTVYCLPDNEQDGGPTRYIKVPRLLTYISKFNSVDIPPTAVQTKIDIYERGTISDTTHRWKYYKKESK